MKASSLSDDKEFAFGRVRINSSGKYEGPLPPKKINEDLALEAKYFRAGDESANALDRFLHPRDMTEVITVLEKEGLRETIRGKKQIKSKFGLACLAWGENDRRTGGTPSVSKISNYFERVCKVMAKERAQNLLRKRLLELLISLRFERFTLKTSITLVRLNEEYAERLLWLVAPPQDLPLLAQTRTERNLRYQSLKSLNDDQIETLLDQLAKSSAENRRYDMYWIFSLIKYGEL